MPKDRRMFVKIMHNAVPEAPTNINIHYESFNTPIKTEKYKEIIKKINKYFL